MSRCCSLSITSPLGIAVDSDKWDLPRWGLMVFGVATMAVGWFVYDTLCCVLGKRPGWLAITDPCCSPPQPSVSNRCSPVAPVYVHVGALIGTIMAANVFLVIIPSQRKMVDAMIRGETPDPGPGVEAERRSLHNNYLTLPVVFIMVSNHFPSTFAAEFNWASLAGLGLTGALVRHWYNLRRGPPQRVDSPVAVAAMLALAVVTAPPTVTGDDVPDDVWAIVQMRCTPCHQTDPTQPPFTTPPKDIIFKEKVDLCLASPHSSLRWWVRGTCPSGTSPLLTDAERAKVVEWAEGGG